MRHAKGLITVMGGPSAQLLCATIPSSLLATIWYAFDIFNAVASSIFRCISQALLPLAEATLEHYGRNCIAVLERIVVFPFLFAYAKQRYERR